MSPERGMAVIGYCRVSTASQEEDGASLDEQEGKIRAHCQAKGLVLLDLYREAASGKSMARRPMFKEVLARLEDKDNPDRPRAVVVAYLDRLTRSTMDAGYMFERQRKNGWQIVALDLGIDTTTASGELVAGVMIQVAQWQRRYISDRTKAGMAEVKKKGTKTGEPIGRPRAMSPEALERLKALRGSGLSYRAMADALNAEGLRGPQGGSWFQQSVRMACIRYNIEGKGAA